MVSDLGNCARYLNNSVFPKCGDLKTPILGYVKVIPNLNFVKVLKKINADYGVTLKQNFVIMPGDGFFK